MGSQFTHAVIFMHGLGDRGSSWLSLPHDVGLTGDDRIKWVFLDSPEEPVTVNSGFVMPSWFDLVEIPVLASTPDDEKGLLRSAGMVQAKVEELLTKHGIPASHVLVGGFSQGGAVAALSMSVAPQRLGGCFMLSGWTPLRSSFKELTKHSGVPCFMGHGEEDDKVVFSLGQVSETVMRDCGFQVDFKSYPGMQHQTCRSEMQDLSAWMKARLLEKQG